MTQTLPAAQHADIHPVTPQVAIGGDPCSYDDTPAMLQLVELCHLGVTHVVDVRVEWSDGGTSTQHAPEVQYLHHGMDDAGQAVPAAWFERAVSWVEDAWAQGPEAVVLTHCHMGIDRGPSLGPAVLLALGWDPVQAIAAIRAARPVIDVYYAADALARHHTRTGTDAATAAPERAALAEWRQRSPLDVVRIIREQRARSL